MSNGLNSEKALIFRITHIDNIPWILNNGLHCRNSPDSDSNFVNIGNLELIGKRHTKSIPIFPFGTLSDYVPFYFTPYSPMMFNIKTGYGVPKKNNRDIVIMVTSLRRIAENGLKYVYTDRHAYLATASYYSSLDDLGVIDWDNLQRRDFKRDPDDPEKVEKYQAEALIHKHLQIDSLMGLVCYNQQVKEKLDALVQAKGLDLDIHIRPKWYF